MVSVHAATDLPVRVPGGHVLQVLPAVDAEVVTAPASSYAALSRDPRVAGIAPDAPGHVTGWRDRSGRSGEDVLAADAVGGVGRRAGNRRRRDRRTARHRRQQHPRTQPRLGSPHRRYRRVPAGGGRLGLHHRPVHRRVRPRHHDGLADRGRRRPRQRIPCAGDRARRSCRRRQGGRTRPATPACPRYWPASTGWPCTPPASRSSTCRSRSSGRPGRAYGADPLNAGIEHVRAAGVLVVASAGNTPGPGRRSGGRPAVAHGGCQRPQRPSSRRSRRSPAAAWSTASSSLTSWPPVPTCSARRSPNSLVARQNPSALDQ